MEAAAAEEVEAAGTRAGSITSTTTKQPGSTGKALPTTGVYVCRRF